MMKWLLILAALMLPAIAVAQEPEKPKWVWIITCTDSDGITLFTEKTGSSTSFNVTEYITLHDLATNGIYYRFFMGNAWCIMMSHTTYESRR